MEGSLCHWEEAEELNEGVHFGFGDAHALTRGQHSTQSLHTQKLSLKDDENKETCQETPLLQTRGNSSNLYTFPRLL